MQQIELSKPETFNDNSHHNYDNIDNNISDNNISNKNNLNNNNLDILVSDVPFDSKYDERKMSNICNIPNTPDIIVDMPEMTDAFTTSGILTVLKTPVTPKTPKTPITPSIIIWDSVDTLTNSNIYTTSTSFDELNGFNQINYKPPNITINKPIKKNILEMPELKIKHKFNLFKSKKK